MPYWISDWTEGIFKWSSFSGVRYAFKAEEWLDLSL